MGRHCGSDAVQGFGIHAVVGPFAALVSADEAAVDEQLHVMGHRGLAQAEWFGEVAPSRSCRHPRQGRDVEVE